MTDLRDINSRLAAQPDEDRLEALFARYCTSRNIEGWPMGDIIDLLRAFHINDTRAGVREWRKAQAAPERYAKLNPGDK
jgi:hypothetical protein